eukprot:GHUV01033882.1.p1 GENE.GHUV01033882.1~~GHUV01033882.1.p1  ORF type:complete len:297 (+),score=49.64 GHUV01033882.1:64-954(+)
MCTGQWSTSQSAAPAGITFMCCQHNAVARCMVWHCHSSATSLQMLDPVCTGRESAAGRKYAAFVAAMGSYMSKQSEPPAPPAVSHAPYDDVARPCCSQSTHRPNNIHCCINCCPLSCTLLQYSSAAPLSADARQRICSELFDLKRFVTVSMTVGPASGVLRDKPQEQWTPREVALTVLVDRSTARLSSGQRTALNDVEESHKEERDGQVYYVYEHTSQGSPTISSLKPETYRHALAVTTTRPGLDGAPYLYTLNVSCPQSLWDDLAGPFKTAVDSFQLVPTTRSYIAPDQNPWLFF